MAVDDSRDRAASVMRILWLTLSLNLAVAALKIAYGHAAAALSIRADGFHSLTDAANNIVGLASVGLASRPADRDHPYGHHKFEVLAAALVGISLLAAAYDVATSAVQRIAHGLVVAPRLDAWAALVLSITLAVNIVVARWEQQRGADLESPFLISDALHTRSDVLVTCGVSFTALFVWLGYPLFDLITAVGISLYIAWTGVGVLRHNVGYLADAAIVDVERIHSTVLAVPGVASAHKIRTRGSPARTYVDLHIQVAPDLNVVEAHRITHEVIDAIKAALPGTVDVVVHTEPDRRDPT